MYTGPSIQTDGLVLALDAGNIKSFRGEPTTNLLPNPSVNGLPTYGNSWSTYNVNQYGNGSYWSIGTTILDVTDNIVTTTSAHPFRTYDVLNPQTSGGGLVAGTHYFIKKLSTTSFTVHHYNSSQDGSQGYINPATGNHKVYDSIALDQRISVNITDFPLMWHGEAHLPNSGLVKEIIPNGFSLDGYNRSDCIRLHYIRDDNVVDGMAYGADAHVSIGSIHTISFYARSVTPSAVGNTCSCSIYNYNAEFSFGFILGEVGVWKRYEYQFTPTTSEYCTTYWFPPADKFKYDIACIQYEQKDHASAFVGGSRGATVETGGGIYDLSGNNNHGILNSNLGTLSFNGVNALNFDSIGKKINGTITNNQPTTDATIESWIFPKTEIDNGDSMGTIIVIYGASSLYQSLNKSNPPQLANYWYSHTPEGYFINGLSDRDQWHHWCSVWNYSDQKLYQFVDGVLVGDISTYGDAATGSSYVIGYETAGRQFSGGIANIKLYNVALSANQVLQNFNSMKSRFGL